MKILCRAMFVAILAAVCAFGASAQFRVGVRAGMNINKLHLQDVGKNVESDNRCGFTAGAMAEFTIPVVGISFDVSLMYTRMNSKMYYDGSTTDVPAMKSSSKDFFQIPVNFKYKIGLPIVGKIITPYIYTGPDFAFRLGHSDAFKHFQAAWDLGIGVELVRHLQIGAGYSWGINNIAKKVTGWENIDGDFKTKNNYWTITAAYLF